MMGILDIFLPQPNSVELGRLKVDMKTLMTEMEDLRGRVAAVQKGDDTIAARVNKLTEDFARLEQLVLTIAQPTDVSDLLNALNRTQDALAMMGQRLTDIEENHRSILQKVEATQRDNQNLITRSELSEFHNWIVQQFEMDE